MPCAPNQLLEFCFDGLKIFLQNDMRPSNFQVHLHEMICVEIFAGCAQLSASLKQAGFSILPIDHQKGKTLKAKLMILDLTKQSDVNVLFGILATANIAYCHCAPVCGTGSRAREIPLPPGMEQFNAEPLRDKHRPLGLPNLRPNDAARVSAANKLYFLTLCVAFVAAKRHFLLSVENPSNAYFWLAMQVLAEQFPLLGSTWFEGESTHFQACAHGGLRDKWTCWFGTKSVFTGLRALCSHDHPKDAWRPYMDQYGRPVFPTKAEAAYPELLCQRVAQIVRLAAIDRGAKVDPNAYRPTDKQSDAKLNRKHGLAALPPIVAEYKLVTDTIPNSKVSYKVISALPSSGKKGDDHALGLRGTQIQLSDEYKTGDALYGVYRDHKEFLDAALSAQHPMDAACHVPEVLARNIAKVLNDGPKLTNARRKLEVLKIKKRALQLQHEEEQLHASMDPEMAMLMKGKNLLLWKELMEQTGVDDPTLFEECVSGFRLVGQAQASPQFPYGFVPMQQTPEELQRKAIWLRKANTSKCRSTGRNELDELVWKQTLEERDLGWLKGPFDENEIDALVGSSQWLATRRFPLEQKDKTRLIDDALASGLNSAYGTSNKLVLFDVDTLVSMVVQIAKAFQHTGKALITGAGEQLPLSVSTAWSRPFQVLGRTLDLQSAYKQVGPYMPEVWNRIIVVYDPHTDKPRYFVSSALMFGSTAAVYAFNRMSRSIWHILAHVLNLWATVYYDDFPMVEMAETAEVAALCIGEILDALGWRYAKTGNKAPPFCEQFDVLGVTVDLLQPHEGKILLKNKASRVRSIVESIDKLILAGKIEPGVASSIHGQLNFAQGQYLGAPLKPSMKFLSSVASTGWNDSMKPLLAVAAIYTKAVMQYDAPRCISLSDVVRPLVVFTDGAWESSADSPAGAGLVVVDPVTGVRASHEVIVPDCLVDHWKEMGKTQLIAELELLPVIIFFEHYKELCRNRRVLLFVDNNAIRDSVSKGSSKTLSVLVLLSELHRLWTELQCLCWVSRVPSLSNVSDLPSRKKAQLAATVINGKLGEPLHPSSKLCDLICDSTSFVQFMRQHLQEKTKK